MVSIIDLQQIEWGYEAANPRWKKVSALYTTPQPVVDVNQQLVVDKYEKLEPALESLVDLCNNLNIGTYDEVIAAEAALEQLYVARWRQKNKRHGAAKGGE
jgi:predicted RNA polymerase sigma factor